MTKEPFHERGIVGVVIASLIILISIGAVIQKRRRKGHGEAIPSFDDLDDLMLTGRYSDNVSDDDEEEEEETGIEAPRPTGTIA